MPRCRVEPAARRSTALLAMALALTTLLPSCVAPPRPPGSGPMFEQKAAGGRVIVTSDDPTFDPATLGLGPDALPPRKAPLRKPHPLSVIEQEKLEAAALAEAIAAPLVDPQTGEDRSAPSPREESGAGRKDDTHSAHSLNPGAALFVRIQLAKNATNAGVSL